MRLWVRRELLVWDMPVRFRKGTPGPRAVTVATAAGDVVLGEPAPETVPTALAARGAEEQIAIRLRATDLGHDAAPDVAR